jgi:hypothetical protein
LLDGRLSLGLLGLLAAALVQSCSEETECTGAACAGVGGAGGGLDCPASGVLYGPWSLRFDETSAVVRWDGCAPHDPSVVVTPEYGGEPATVTGTQTETEVLTTFDIIDGVKPDLPGTRWVSEVEVGGLEPGLCYTYALAAEAERTGRFCTAKPSGESFWFMAIGDTNPTFGETEGVLAQTLSERPDFVAHMGDIQYYASVFESWAEWFPRMQPMLAAGPFLPAIGNHEVEENEHEYEDYYVRLFGNAGFDGNVEHYRYQSGGVWFFVLNSEDDVHPGSPQAEWLEQSIADAAAQPGYRAGVVYVHKPWITLADYSQDEDSRLYFHPLFVQHGVVLLLQGHVHGYERFVDGAVTYVTTGGGGALRHDLDVNIAARPAEAALRVASESEFHGMIFSVGGASVEGRAISHEGMLIDEFEVPLP